MLPFAWWSFPILSSHPKLFVCFGTPHCRNLDLPCTNIISNFYQKPQHNTMFIEIVNSSIRCLLLGFSVVVKRLEDKSLKQI